MVSIEKIISYRYLLGAGTILGGSISGCNMKATSTRICFIGVHVWDKFSQNLTR